MNLESLDVIAYLLTAALLLRVLYTVVHNFVTPFDDKTEMRSGNTAAIINRSGAYAGLVLAMSGSLVMSKAPFADNYIMFVVDGASAIVVFVLAHFVLDLVILRGVNNSQAIQNRNTAVAVTEACAYVALGLIIGASFSGDGDKSVMAGIINACVFSGIGLLTLALVYTGYDVVRKLVSGFSVDKEITRGNVAAGIEAGSLMLSTGAVLWFSIAGDFTTWAGDLRQYAFDACIGVLCVVLSRLITCVFFSRELGVSSAGVHHGSVGAASMMAGASTALSILAGLALFA